MLLLFVDLECFRSYELFIASCTDKSFAVFFMKFETLIVAEIFPKPCNVADEPNILM